MKKQLTNRTVYKPNGNVTITVVNKPVWESGSIVGYDNDVTIKTKRRMAPDEIKFATDDDIEEYISNIDASEPQTSLSLGGQ